MILDFLSLFKLSHLLKRMEKKEHVKEDKVLHKFTSLHTS